MNTFLRTIFSPILKPFESGSEPYVYKPLNRKVLITIGVLFSFLIAVIVAIGIKAEANLGEYFIVFVVFGGVALVSLVVGFLGSERAVSKIWGSR